MSPEAFFRDLLAHAGVTVNGGRQWDLQVRDQRAYTRMMRDGTIGFGEAFMAGWLDCERFDLLAERAFRADLSSRFEVRAALAAALKARLSPFGSRRRSFEIGDLHYDAGNDFFEALLDPTMAYSCGYWEHADDLEAAQHAKLDLICRKLKLEPGMRVLDIGSGWGSFARFAAAHYGVSVVGITVSREQIDFATRFCAGLPATFRYLDYRDIDETFDRVVSDRHVRACRPPLLPRFFRGLRPVRKPVRSGAAAHDRPEARAAGQRLVRQIHCPRRRDPDHSRRGRGGAPGSAARRSAHLLRDQLRQDADGVVGEP